MLKRLATKLETATAK